MPAKSVFKRSLIMAANIVACNINKLAAHNKKMAEAA
jgi:hypothetical protein